MKVVDLDEIKRAIKIPDLFEPIRQSFIDFSSGKLISSPVNLLYFANGADAHIKIAAIKLGLFNGY